MRFRFLLAITALCALAQPAVTFLNPPSMEATGAPRINCQSLAASTGFEFTIESAAIVPADGQTPEFCRVMGQILPEIRFELALPTA